MKFSFLLCTRNSERLLNEVICSIINQCENKEELEVILVDYKSTDSTLSIAREVLSRNHVSLVEIACGVSGKSPAMVLGLDAASGEYVIVVDDDNILFPDFIQEAKKILESNKVGCVGSQGIIDETLELPAWFPEYKGVYAIGPPGGGQKIDWVWGAGSIINTVAWKKLRKNGFNLILNPVRESQSTPIAIGGEDVELALAIKLIGYEVIFSEKLKFFHKFPQSRLTETYLLENCFGVSRSVPVHEIYRLVMYRPNTLFPKLMWHYVIFRSIIGRIIGIGKSYLSDNELTRRHTQAILFGIASGFFGYRTQYDSVYKYLMKLQRKLR